MSLPRPARSHVIAVLLGTVAALFARAWFQLRLVGDGYERSLAEDLSYLVVPPVLLILLFPVLLEDRAFIKRQFRCDNLSPVLLLKAITIGVLFRVAWHGHIVAATAFGLYQSGPIPAADFSFDCPSLPVLGLSVLVASFLIPFIEEFVHRGYVQSFFGDRGPLVAIAISSLTFVLFHPFGAWQFVFAGGVLLGTLYWITGSLWVPVIVHAVTNFIPQLTLRCMTIPWNPTRRETPIWSIGLLSVLVCVVAATGLLWLTLSLWKRRDNASRRDAVKMNQQHVQ